ncbi:MAG: hypothetical protein QOE61_4793 [Micromonosporaceae bacterium]|jgi:hypothetical protein|nr:hypothetical protein [Micromonosporaceae bacterium]
MSGIASTPDSPSGRGFVGPPATPGCSPELPPRAMAPTPSTPNNATTMTEPTRRTQGRDRVVESNRAAARLARCRPGFVSSPSGSGPDHLSMKRCIAEALSQSGSGRSSCSSQSSASRRERAPRPVGLDSAAPTAPLPVLSLPAPPLPAPPVTALPALAPRVTALALLTPPGSVATNGRARNGSGSGGGSKRHVRQTTPADGPPHSTHIRDSRMVPTFCPSQNEVTVNEVHDR